MNDFQHILLADAGQVATITLNRPKKRNAIGPRMIAELCAALERLDQGEHRVIVLTGAGEAFCAGGDLSEMSAGIEDIPARSFPELLLKLDAMTIPVVAKVGGAALGGGLGLVCASHFAVASEDAVLGTPEIKVGLFPMMIMASILRQVPERRARQMLCLGERVSADEALRMGLLNRVVSPERLDEETAGLVGQLASASPVVMRLGLEAMRGQRGLLYGEALSYLEEMLGRCLATADCREGLLAFMQKRAPEWTGKEREQGS